MKKKATAIQLQMFEVKGIGEKADAKIRRLKIQYGHHNNSYKHHPVIRIAGGYLKEFGFKIGDTVELKLAEGRIEITRLEQL